MYQRIPVLLLIALSLLLEHAQPAFGQSPAPEPNVAKQSPVDSEQLGSISGRVVDAESGAPVTSGWVTAMARNGGSVNYGGRLQPDGSYRIYRLAPGEYLLRLMAAGYIEMLYNPEISLSGLSFMTGAGAPVAVKAGVSTDGINFKVPRYGEMSGRVLDEQGQPVNFAQVKAIAAVKEGGQTRFVPLGIAQTNDRGEYRMWGLKPGDYLVSATPNPAVTISNIVDRSDPDRDKPILSYEPVFYPGVTERSQSSRVRIAAGEKKYGIDFQLNPIGSYTVSGVVLMPDGSPASNCAFVISKITNAESDGLETMAYTRVKPRDGTFIRSGLTSGQYRAMGGSIGEAAGYFLNENILVDDRDIDQVVLRLRKGSRISGTLRLEGENGGGSPNRPAPSATVYLLPLGNDQMISFRGMGITRRSQDYSVVGEDGQFRFEDVPPLLYKIRAQLAGGYYLSQVLVGAQDVSAGGIDLTQSSGEVSVRLMARADGGSITGMTSNADGIAQGGVEVRLYPVGVYEERDDFRKRSVSDQTGSFTLETVVPGEYVLVAAPAGQIAPNGKSNTLEKLKNDGLKVTVRPNSSQQLHVTVQKVEATQ